ncbi:MAG: multidrug effflux MFS transporter [Pseudomonadota bacterium]
MARLDPVENERPLLAILVVLVFLTPFAVDAYLPALPGIARDLAAPGAMVQLTIGAFLAGMAAGPLMMGPLSDRFGRRPPLVVGLAIFAIASAACALVSSVEALIAWRFVQAAIGSAALVSGTALLADLYDRDTMAARQSFLMIFVSTAPMIAPLVGEWIASASSWRGIFWMLTFVGAAAGLATFVFLPETLPPEKRSSVSPGALARGYLSILGNRTARLYIITGGCMSGGFFAYLAGSPFLYQNLLGFSSSGYAWIFALGAALCVPINILNIRLVRRLGFRRTLLYQGIAAITLGAALFLGAFGGLGSWLILLSGVFLMPFQHIVTANCQAGVLNQFDTRKGAASAVALSSRFAAGAVAVAIMGETGGTAAGYALTIFAFLALTGVMAQFTVRRDKTA